jgi:hypothetical protein
MRNIGITTFVTLLMLGTAIIGSGHVVLARNFSNSGNYLVNDQNCTAGTCNLSSSNTVTSGSSGLTSPPPSTPSVLTLFIVPATGAPPGLDEISGSLRAAGSPVAGATITFTVTNPGGTTSPLNLGSVVTDLNGNYGPIPVNTTSPDTPISGSQVTAHYAGAPPVNAIAASSASSFAP